MPQVRCSMVMSPNGYIAKLDGDEEWISEINWTDFVADAKACNNFVVGRETYELVMKLYEDYNFDNVEAAYKIVVSGQTDFRAKEGYVVVNSPQAAIDYLSQQNITEILLAGGGKLNAAFAEANLIDELELIVEPYIIGNGRQMLATGDYEFPLELLSVDKLDKGRVKVLYKVIR